MAPPEKDKLITIVAALLVGSWVLIFAGLLFARPPQDRFLLGLCLGLTYGLATLAAAWTALGPGAIGTRIAAGLAWSLALCLAWLAYHMGDVEQIWFSILGQWLLAQLPLWLLRRLRGVHIRPLTERMPADPAWRQFGIRQLLILTTAVAAILGMGRAVAPLVLAVVEDGSWGELPVLLVVVAANIVLTLPLGLAALLPRFAAVACGVGLLFVALATYLEFSLLGLVMRGRTPPAEVLFMLWIMNGCQAACVLLGVGLLRWAGYRLA